MAPLSMALMAGSGSPSRRTRCAIAQPLGQGILGQAEVAEQPLHGTRLFHRVEVGALQILDQRQFQALFEAAAASRMDDDRDFRQARDLGRAKSAFAGDQLISGQALADQQRLQDAVHPDGVGQLLQRPRLEATAGLFRIGPDVGDRDLHGEASPRAVVRAQLLDVLPRWDQGLEAPTESPSFVHLAINSFVSSW